MYRIFTLFLSNLIFSQAQVDFLKTYDGMVTLNMGKTYLEKGTLSLMYDLNPPTDLVRLLCHLKGRIQRTSKMVTTWQANKTDSPVSEEVMQKMLQDLDRKLIGIFDSNYLTKRTEDCDNATLSDDNFIYRHERGLINLGGDLLKFLFGTVVEDDVKDFQDTTRTLSRQVKLVMMENSQHLRELNENFKSLEVAHQTQTKKLFYIDFESFIAHANSVLEETKTSMILVDTIVSSAILNVVHPTLLPFKDFKNIITEGITSLRLSPLLPLTFDRYYQYLALCSINYKGNSFSVRVNIPFSDDVSYEAFLAYPFPNIRHKDYYLEIDTNPTIIARSAHHYFQMSLLEFDQCKHANALTLCYTRDKKTLTASCLLNLIRESEINLCRYKKRSRDTVSDDPIIVTFEGNSLINFGNNNTKASIACPGKQKTIMTTDIIYVPSPCSLISNKLTLLPKKTHHYNRVLKIPITNTYLNLPSQEYDLGLNTSNFTVKKALSRGSLGFYDKK